MVRFANIYIQTDDDLLGFDCLDLFNEFRSEAWALSPPQKRKAWHSVLNAQHNLEQIAEQRFNLPKGTFKGLCLAYGTARSAFKQLRRPELIPFLAHWNTSVTLTIKLTERKAIATIIGSKYRTVAEIPLKYLLLPEKANLIKAYNNVAVRKQLGVIPPALSN